MKLSKYRIAAGHYAVGEFTIYGCYPRWQVRDFTDDTLDDFATLREAIAFARTLMMADALRQLDTTLSKPHIAQLVDN